MKNNKIKVLLALMAAPFLVHAQVYISSGTGFYISAGDYISIKGDVDINENIQGSGTVIFNGTTAQNLNAHGFGIPAVEVNNTSGVVLASDAAIGNSLMFTAGTVTLGNNNLSFNTGATLSGYASGKHLVTNGTGVVTAATVAASGNFVFPVGFSSSSYSPLSVSNGATAQSINVSVKDYSSSASNEGTTQNGMDRSWQIYTSAGGPLSTLALTHDATLNGSNYYSAGAFITRQQATVGRWSNPGSASYGGIVTPPGETGAIATLASVSDTYHSNTLVLGSTATSAADASSWYSKASRSPGLNTYAASIAVSTSAILQGAFNSGTGTMSNTLQTLSLLPTASTTAYTSSPRADYASINNTGGSAGTLTDWVEVQLRDAATPATVVERRALLLKPDGRIVNEFGTTPIFASLPGNYFITVVHRNHLGIRSATAQNFTAGTITTYDFATAQAQAYQDPSITTNAAMANLGGGKFGMWGGNANGNTRVSYSGLNNDYTYLTITILGNNLSTPLTNVYHIGDLNLNGRVSYSGISNDYTFLTNTVLGTVLTQIINQHQ